MKNKMQVWQSAAGKKEVSLTENTRGQALQNITGSTDLLTKLEHENYKSKEPRLTQQEQNQIQSSKQNTQY